MKVGIVYSCTAENRSDGAILRRFSVVKDKGFFCVNFFEKMRHYSTFMVKITYFMQKVQTVVNSVNSASEVKNAIKSAKKNEINAAAFFRRDRLIFLAKNVL